MDNLAIKTSVHVGSIEFNNEELKKNISDQVKEFDGSVFNEDSIQTGKIIVANLRKRKEEAKKVDKQVKTEMLKPYEEFHAKVTELTDLLDKPIDNINTQLDEMEEKRKAEKREQIKATYEELVDGFEEYIPIEKIYDSKWENKTTTMKSIKAEINKIVDSTAQAITTITNMNSEYVPEALEMYKKDLSVINAIAFINDKEQTKARILEEEKAKRAEEEEREKQRKEQEEERKHQAEIERIRAEERAKLEAEQRAEQEKIGAEQERLEEIERAKEEERARVEAEQEAVRQKELEAMQAKKSTSETHMVNYKIIATDEEFAQVEMYLNSIGVEFIKGDF